MPKHHDEETKEQAITLYISHFNARQIGEKLGITKETARNWIEEYHNTLESRLSEYAIKEFEREFFKTIHAIEADIARLTNERQHEQDPALRLKIDDMIHARRMDVHELRGDSDMIMALRKMEKDAHQKIA